MFVNIVCNSDAHLMHFSPAFSYFLQLLIIKMAHFDVFCWGFDALIRFFASAIRPFFRFNSALSTFRCAVLHTALARGGSLFLF
ncbi:MAG: hypothetical protein CMF60_07420 [Magnetococcales bacterium]|nr:hypothetical protein [Magnetococcales bacterium]